MLLIYSFIHKIISETADIFKMVIAKVLLTFLPR